MGLFNQAKNNQPNKLTLEANGLLDSQPQVVPVAATPSVDENATPRRKFTISKRWKKYGLIGSAVMGVVLLALAIFTLTGLDLSVMQPYLTGRVTSEGKPVANVSVKTKDNAVNTDINGNYTITNLSPGQYDIEVFAEGFEVIKTRISIGRSYLNYANRQDFELKSASATAVTGKIVVSDPTYNFLDDTIVVGDKTFEIESSGEFTLANLPTGEQTLEYRSLNYKDLVQKITLQSGANEIGEFTTTPAGDLVASTKSFLNETIVADLTVVVEGVEPEQITISEEGILRVKDLEIAKQYRIQISHPQYESRQYTTSTKQGESQILNFRVVEKGKVPFLRKIDNRIQLMVADYDGENIVQLTTDDAGPLNEYIDATQVYFNSTKDRVSSNTSTGRVPIPYVVPVAGGTPQRVMNQFNNIGRVIANYKAKKLLIVRRGDTNRARVLEVADLDGTNRRALFSGGNITFNDVLLADTGKHAAFTIVDLDDSNRNGLYWSNMQNEPVRVIQKPSIIVNAISANGDRILYTTTNTQTGVSDLYVYIVSQGRDTLIRSSWRGQQAQFLADSENDLVFFELREGASNIFQLNLADNKETQLTTFTSAEGVSYLSQQPGLIVYHTSRGLYVMNAAKPLAGKLTTTNFTRAGGS